MPWPALLLLALAARGPGAAALAVDDTVALVQYAPGSGPVAMPVSMPVSTHESDHIQDAELITDMAATFSTSFDLFVDDHEDEEQKKGNDTRRVWQVGDHVLVEIIDGELRGTWVKGSIAGRGADAGTYDVHLWFGPPRHRERPSVPLELLHDAGAMEAQEAADAKAAEETEKREESERQRLEAEHKAAEEAEVRKKEEEKREAQKKAEDEERERLRQLDEAIAEAEEGEKKQKEAEDLKQRKESMKAKWIESQAAKLKYAEEAGLETEALRAALNKTLEHRKRRTEALAKIQARTEAKAQAQAKTRADAEAKAQADAEAKASVIEASVIEQGRANQSATAKKRFVKAQGKLKEQYSMARVEFKVRDARGKEAVFYLRRQQPFKIMMKVACQRLGLQPEKSTFSFGNKKVDPTDFVGKLGIKQNDVVRVRGPLLETEKS